MFIELTDHLRCPNEHEESFLVLLPGTMEGRSVRTGDLGCPVCGRTFQLTDGVFDTRDWQPPQESGSVLDADAITALSRPLRRAEFSRFVQRASSTRQRGFPSRMLVLSARAAA